MKINKDDLQKIKLVIWDLDDTFWDGTLSDNHEGGSIIPIPEHVELVKTLTGRGIVNAICSKNNQEDAENKLAELGILDYFVFNSINWKPKGERVKHIINTMSLRPANVLFIDDNNSNLNEVEFVSPEIFTASPDFIPEIIGCASSLGKDDSSHSRLSQYKILETKRHDEAQSSSNIEFLKASKIKLCIKTDKLEEDAERIEELIQRSNQLNFTKKRISIDEVKRLLQDARYSCGIVLVSDKYGSYGMVGFYAVYNNTFEHFLFSCRTMGMGIEQYVYATLKYPKLEVVGDVSANVSIDAGKPGYIEEVNTLNVGESIKNNKRSGRPRVLLKGPCDLEVMRVYLADGDYDIVTEFNFVDSKGNQADFYNHSIHILNSLLDKSSQERLSNTYSIITPETFKTTLFSGDYNVVCLSPLMDATLAVYREKSSVQELAFGIYNAPLTDPANWDSYVNKKVMTAKVNITIDEIKDFCKRVYRIEYTADKIASNYREIVNKIKRTNTNTRIVFILLPELKYVNNNPGVVYTFEGKEFIHHKINTALKKAFEGDAAISFLDVNKFVKKQSDYFDNINHFSKMVYFYLAQEFVSCLNSYGIKVETQSAIKACIDNMKRWMYKKFIMGHERRIMIFKLLHAFYRKIQ